MLRRLGRWLRAAGYDIAIAEGGAADAVLIARCVAEGRTLVTLDRHLEARAQWRVPVIRLAGDSGEARARVLRSALGIDWEYAPFSRCLIDNAPLDPAPTDMEARAPVSSRAAAGGLRICPSCGRLYWPGGTSGEWLSTSPPGTAAEAAVERKSPAHSADAFDGARLP